MRRSPSILFACLAAAAAVPAHAGKGGPHPVAKLLAEADGASVKDITVVAVAEPLEREHAAGSAALVRVDDGRDGGMPSCWLLDLAGKPYAPGKIDSRARLSVCPMGPAKGAQLRRVALSVKHEAWLLRIESQRYDSKAQGGETAALWGLYGKLAGESEVRPLWERTSTTFFSKVDPSSNQAERCQAPQVAAAGQEPDTVTIDCDTEITFNKLTKKAKQTFRSKWAGDRYSGT
jgi:hypothetical protein